MRACFSKICCASPRYQSSENCKLELKFAKQSGVEIVPVMAEGKNWRPSNWLGLITAGALWTPLIKDADFEDNIAALAGQVKKSLPEVDDDHEETIEPIAETRDEMTEELERLKEALTVTTDEPTEKVDTTSETVCALVPSIVPELPPRYRATAEIRELTP